ncbi:MAG: hypothetical protein RLN60_03870 [Phycisphaerales bacterium]
MPDDGKLNVLFFDLNAYFASVEQQLRPELRGKPLGIVPLDVETTCCITCSYEARAFGVRTGMGLREAKERCPGLVVVPARPRIYTEMHHQILNAIDTVIPIDQVHSIDELSVRLLAHERERESAVKIAKDIKRAVAAHAGEYLTSSIGIAPNRMLAKLAGDMHKPDGLTVIERKDLPEALYKLELTDFPGIADAMERRLHRAGIRTVQELCACSKTRMREAWGSIVGEQWWHYLQGHDVREKATTRRTIGHQHVLPPEYRTKARAREVLVRLVAKASTRARKLGYHARQMTVFARVLDRALSNPRRVGWKHRELFEESRDSRLLTDLANRAWDRFPEAEPLLVGVVLHDLVPDCSITLPLFERDAKERALSDVIDEANVRFGVNALYTASMQNARTTAPRRISFGNIPDLDIPDVDERYTMSEV